VHSTNVDSYVCVVFLVLVKSICDLNSGKGWSCDQRLWEILIINLVAAVSAFSALTVSVGWQEGHPACKH